MKKTPLLLFACLAAFNLSAQNQQRHIKWKIYGKDSINLRLSDEYYLIEDSCAQVVRYGHYDVKERKFRGKFTDVSTATPDLVVAEGFYTENGLKDGPFITHYLNGKLQAKGNFKENKYDGHWEVYYDSGQPKLTFDVTDGICHITDAWDEKGKKRVDNGTGTYTYRIGGLDCIGKLLNGTPDGTWKLQNRDDISGEILATEHFKKGKFRDGSIGAMDYTDASHISLNTPLILPFVNAEELKISPVACDGSVTKHKIIRAQYPGGYDGFSQNIKDIVAPYFAQINLSGIEQTFDVNGEVSEKGDLINLKMGSSSAMFTFRRIIDKLQGMPPLHPATVDGKPVRQGFYITFTIHNGYYTFTYKFLPISVNP
jgi:hypothetical protein